MKFIPHLRWAVAVAALAGLTACGDDTAPLAQIDSAPLQSIDAPQAADAAITADAGVDATLSDAPPPDATPSPVSVEVAKNGQAAIGVTVVFLNPDNSVVLETTTDSNGRAESLMPLGGSVTAFDAVVDGPALPNLYTFLGVQNGMTLLAGNIDGNKPAGITLNVTVPLAMPLAMANVHYRISSPCLQSPVNTSTLTTQVTLTTGLNDCTTQVDFLVEATFAGTDALGSIYNQGVTVNAGDITLTGTYAAVTNTTQTTMNLPAGDFSAVDFTYGIGAKAFALSQGDFTNEVVLTPIDTSGQVNFTVPTVTNADVGYYGVMTARKFDGASIADVFIKGTAGDVFFDAVHFPLPTIEAQHAVDESGNITWTETGAGEAGTVEAMTTFTTTDNQLFNWYVAGPHTGTSMTLPKLPSDLSLFNFSSITSGAPASIAISDLPWTNLAGFIFVIDYHSPSFLTFGGGGTSFGFAFSYNEGFFCPSGFHLDRKPFHSIHPC